MQLFRSFRNYDKSNLSNDIIGGVVVAALTIPISMGYAQVAGLPPVYGLYGSLLPVIGYALFASSPQTYVGVDAAGAAITGSVVASAGIAAYSDQAYIFVPLMALLTGVFLIIFSLCRLGRLIGFVSQPVMGGFISGLAISIMFTQVPKIMGVTMKSGSNVIESIINIGIAIPQINWPSFWLAVVSFVIIILMRIYYSHVPTPLVVLVISILITSGGLAEYGVPIMGEIQSGLPPFGIGIESLFDTAQFGGWGTVVGYAATIAAVVMIESLMCTSNFSTKNGYRIDDNQELLGYGISNLLSGFSGSTPVSANVARTAAADSFGAKSQVSSIISAVVILGVLFITPLLYYLPMPVLSAIVLSALTTVVEWKMALRLLKTSRRDFVIFIASMFGVLFGGLMVGVAVGVTLSFVALLADAANPPRTFVGTKEGKSGYFSLTRYTDAKPIGGVLIYRFSSRLTFTNARVFAEDIEDAFTPDIRLVLIDASGIGDIDATASDRIDKLARKIESTGARMYFCQQIPSVDDTLRKIGLERLCEKPGRSNDIEDVLADFGINPYPQVDANQFRIMRARFHCSMLLDSAACEVVRLDDPVEGQPQPEPNPQGLGWMLDEKGYEIPMPRPKKVYVNYDL